MFPCRHHIVGCTKSIFLHLLCSFVLLHSLHLLLQPDGDVVHLHMDNIFWRAALNVGQQIQTPALVPAPNRLNWAAWLIQIGLFELRQRSLKV